MTCVFRALGYPSQDILVMAGGGPIVCLDDFEKHAFQTLPQNALDYYRSGANDEITLRDNIESFRRRDGVLSTVHPANI